MTFVALLHFPWIVAVPHRRLEQAAVMSIGQGMNELCPMPGCRVEASSPADPNFLRIDARGTRPGGRCPDCGRASRAVHSRYHRHSTDLPSMGRRVHVDLRIRRFYCRNSKCGRHTFAERLPELVAPRARRTARLAQAQGQVGAALGGEAGARLLHRLAMPASPDTVLRLVRRLPLPMPEPARVMPAPPLSARPRQCRWLTAGICLPMCATCWNAGWPVPTPGRGVSRCCPAVMGTMRASGPRPFAAAALRLLLALTAAPVDMPPTRTYAGATWPAGPCSPLAAPPTWRGRQCASTPMP